MNMEYVTLNNGVKMPMAGIGTFLLSPDEAEVSVLSALQCGYRLIDTANAYVNEKAVGRAMKRSGLKREEIFLETKLWSSFYEQDDAVDKTLARLDTDYIDLLLIHQPFSDYVGTWRAMEHAVKEGKVRAIGLSNFYPDRFVDMAEYSTIKPAVNQLVANVFSQQWDAQAEMKPYGTRLMAWGPLAQGNPELQDHPLMQRLASKYGKTPQQVALRYLIERDIIAIPKTTHFDRMKQNLDVFDFELTSEEMQSLRALDRPIDFRWSHRNPELVRFLWNYDKNFNPKNQAE